MCACVRASVRVCFFCEDVCVCVCVCGYVWAHLCMGVGFYHLTHPRVFPNHLNIKLLQALNCVCLHKALIPQTLTCQERQSNPCFTPPPSLSLSLSLSSSFSRCFTVLVFFSANLEYACICAFLVHSCVDCLPALALRGRTKLILSIIDSPVRISN